MNDITLTTSKGRKSFEDPTIDESRTSVASSNQEKQIT